MRTFNNMIGRVMVSVAGQVGSGRMTFTADNGRSFLFLHLQDCCENVQIEDICGDLSDLVGAPLTMAEEVSSDDAPKLENEESYTWTFYKFGTAKGSVTVRWLGTSNGYYSESVDYEET